MCAVPSFEVSQAAVSGLFHRCVRVLQVAVFAFCLHLKQRSKLSLRQESVRSKFTVSESSAYTSKELQVTHP